MARKFFGLFIVCTLIFVNNNYSQCALTSGVLPTYYATNNGQRGVMFNIEAYTTTTIVCFDMNLYSGTTAPYEIYYKTGSLVGFENNAAAWTFIGSAASVTSLGSNVPTPVPIMVNITIPAGQTYAFYVTNTSGGGTSYTNGASATNLIGSDANIGVRSGVGKSYPFGLSFNYREVNGTVHYEPGPLPIELLQFDAKQLNRLVQLTWTTATEINNDYFTVQRSQDGISWENLLEVDGSGNTSTQRNYEALDEFPLEGVSYYRLKQTDYDGDQSFYDPVSVNFNDPGNILIYPNPFQEVLRIEKFNGELEITNSVGMKVNPIVAEDGDYITANFEGLPNGVYFIRINNGVEMTTYKVIKN